VRGGERIRELVVEYFGGRSFAHDCSWRTRKLSVPHAFTLPNGNSLIPEIHVSDHIELEALRERLRTMTDAKLLRFGKDNRYMCSPYANLSKPPLEAFVIQLHEARAEWRRRHPKAW
jgi:hypothetical protein